MLEIHATCQSLHSEEIPIFMIRHMGAQYMYIRTSRFFFQFIIILR